jgi:regulator of sirC expression with transglutaminase-like and TPR domain
MRMDTTDAFADLMGRDDDEIELDRAALLFAAVEYPDLDVEASRATLDLFADLVRPRLSYLDSPSEVVQVISATVHGELGFRGNTDAYYDPRNSYLHQVLERRLGIPITLSAVYIEIGRRLDLPFEGVGMPGHFLVRLPGLVAPVLVDPFDGGTVLDEAACTARLRHIYGPRVRFDSSMLAPVGTRAIVFRMLANLKGIYLSQSDWPRVIRTIDLMLVTEPGASSEYRDRGAAHLRQGDLRRARADFEHYLLNAVDVDDAATVREQLGLVERLEAMRN